VGVFGVSVPAGWYDDGTGRQRWWDGRVWTGNVRENCPPQSELVLSAQMGDREDASGVQVPEKRSVFNKLGTTVMKVVEDRAAAKEEMWRRRAELDRAAGELVTSGVFGVSKVEIFRNGYVRIGDPSAFSATGRNAEKPPYEKLISIAFVGPEVKAPGGMTPHAAAGDVAVQTVAAITKGASIMKATAPGLVVVGAAHAVKAMSGKSILTIATDREVHTLTNQVEFRIVKKDHEEVGRVLEREGTSVLAANGVGALPVPVPALPAGETSRMSSPGPATASAPTVSDRLRELAALHAEGLLNDAEFSAAKKKLLESL